MVWICANCESILTLQARNDAATKIQSNYRGYQARKRVEGMKADKQAEGNQASWGEFMGPRPAEVSG